MDIITRLPVKNISFHIMRELQCLEDIMPQLPENEVYKIISCGHFSSIAFVKYLADRTTIKNSYFSTLKVGKKHIAVLDNLHREKKLINCSFIIGSIMERVNKDYEYYDILKTVCKNNNWDITVFNNHSKLLLFDTDNGKYVLETSSNLNENPSVEQFSFEKNEMLYEHYLKFFEINGAKIWT